MKLEVCYTTELLPHVMNYKGSIVLKNDVKKSDRRVSSGGILIFEWRLKKTM